MIYAYAPLTRDDVAKLRWPDDINVIISKVFAPANRNVRVVSVDPVAASNVDEDLDYRIAQRVKSMEGWQSFLAAHPDGPRTQSARAELDKLVGAQKPPAPAAAQAPNNGSSNTKTMSEVARPGRPSHPSEAATLASDEICKRDEDHLQQLSTSPTSDEAMRFLAELRCEKLRPELFRLTEHLDYQDPNAVAAATQSYPSNVAQTEVAGRRATEPQDGTRGRVASRSLQPRRHATRGAAPSLPPILMALFGDRPRNSTAFRRTRISAGLSSGGRGG